MPNFFISGLDMRYPREWSSYFNTLSMVNNQLHWCLLNYEFTRQKSLQTLPGKVNLLFRFSRILDLYAGGRHYSLLAKAQQFYGATAIKVGVSLLGRRMTVEAAGLSLRLRGSGR